MHLCNIIHYFQLYTLMSGSMCKLEQNKVANSYYHSTRKWYGHQPASWKEVIMKKICYIGKLLFFMCMFVDKYQT